MRFICLTISLMVGATVAFVLPREAADSLNSPEARATAAGSCTIVQTHYEWRSLTDAHKANFTAAVRCLSSKPPRSGLPRTLSRWDDLVAIYQHLSPSVLNTGQWLPWQRYFLHIFELELRNTCGYTGPMTWWDETKDAGHFSSAPMMTAQYLGKAPVGNSQCVVTIEGNPTPACHIGPGQNNLNHCLARGVNEQTSASVTSSFVNTCLANNNFASMESCLFYGPNAFGADAIGGDLSDINSGPNDPLFYLHAGFIDRDWRIWQNTSPSARTYAIGGNTVSNCGSNCQPTTLDYQLSSLGFYPSVAVRQVIDTTGSYLCYKYDY